MLIAFTIFKYFPFGGVQRDMVRMAGRCMAAGHRVRIYTLQWHGAVPDGFDVVLVPVRALTNHRRYQRFARWVAGHVAANPPDAVVGMNKMPGLDVYFAADSCYADKARTQRGWWYRRLPRYRAFCALEAAVFGAGSTTEIMTIAELQACLYKYHYGTPAARLHALPPGIDRSRMAPPDRAGVRYGLRTEFGIGDDELLLLFLGSGFIKKGLDRALRGLAAVPPSLRARTRMLVVGQDNPRRFAAMARRLGVAGRVRFLPGRDDVPRLLFGADLLVLPAYDETAGIVILEAIVAGLPALVTANCGYAPYIEAAGADRVVPAPYSQRDYDRLLVEMLQDDAAREAWGRRGIAFGRQADIYDLHDHAARFIIGVAGRRANGGRDAVPEPGRVAGGSRRLWLREDLSRWLGPRDPFDVLMHIDGDVYRALASRCTLRIDIDGRGYFVKRHAGVGWREIVKNLTAGKRPVVDASNEHDACRRLTQAGIGTLKVAGFGVSGTNPARRRSFIVTDELRDHLSLEDWCETWQRRPPAARLKRALIARVGALARTMHDAGVVHRDFYICHLLIDRLALEHGRIELAVIDLHRARVRGRATRRWIVRDLGALLFSTMDLGLSATDRFRFIAAYARGRPADALRARRRFWAAVQRRAKALYLKGRRPE